MKILVVVDMQNDFIDGALGTKEAVSIVPRVVEKIRQFDGKRSGSLTEGFFIPEIPTKKITWRLRREEICRFRTASGERKVGNWPRRSKRSGQKRRGKKHPGRKSLLISRPLGVPPLEHF